MKKIKLKIPGAFRRRKFLTIPLGLILVVSIGLFIYVRFAYGVTRTWDGGCGVDTSWSCDANWSSDTEPGASDLAQFDTFDGDANIDATYAGSVGGVQITANYDGTITQSRSLTVGSQAFSQAGGTWNGGAQTFDINDTFTVSGGVHTATTGTWTVSDNFTHSAGTLTMTGATVTFDADDTTLTCSGVLGGTVVVSKDADGDDFILSSGCEITITTFNSSNVGTVTINGTLNHSGSTFVVNDETCCGSGGHLIVSNTGTIVYSGTAISIDGNFTQNGTFNLSGKTVTLGAGNSSTLTCTGTLGGTVALASGSDGTDFTLAAGCEITMTTLNATRGTLTINGTLNHTGSTFNVEDDVCCGSGGHFTVNSGGAVYYSGTSLLVDGNFTIASGGIFDLTGKTLTFGNGNGSTLTCTGTLSGTIAVESGADNDDFTLAAGCTATASTISGTFGTITINGTLNITGSTFNLDDDVCCGSGGHFAVGSTGRVSYSGTNINIDGNFTQGGTFDMTGKTLTLESGNDSTFRCTTSSGFNLIINKSSETTTQSGNCAVADFTRTDGVLSNPSSRTTLEVNGNFSMSTTDVFGGPNLILEFAGGNNQTITQNAGTINNNILVNKTGGTGSLSTDLRTNGAATVSAGIMDLNNKTFLSPQGFRIADGGTLELYGSEAYTIPSYNIGATVKYTGDGDAGADTYGLGRTTQQHHVTVATTDSSDTVSAGNTLASSIEGYWNMDESSWTNDCSTGTILDSSANSNEALSCPASTGPTGGATGNFGNAGFFDGSDDYVSILHNAAYNNSGTWNIWMKSDGTWGTGASDPTNRAAIMSKSESNSCSGVHILPRPSGIITVAIYRPSCSGATVANFQSNSSVVTDNNWHMVTLVFNQASGGRIALYVDGVLDNFANTSNSWSFSAHNARLARDFDSFWETYEGYLDDVRIYSRELSAQEIANLYADGINTSTSTLDINGNFTQSSGTFTAPTSTFTIGGNFSRSGGTFSHNSGTVVLNDATQTANISGSTTFNNLTSTTGGKNIILESGSAQTISTLTLTGSAGNRIVIKGSAGSSQWDLIATTPNVSYVEARDSDACGGTSVTATNSVNLGNNSCWSFTENTSSKSNIRGNVNIRGNTNLR